MAPVNFTRALSPAGQHSPVRPVDSNPSMDEARRARIELAIAYSLKAAAPYDAAGSPADAAASRADAALMLKAIAS